MLVGLKEFNLFSIYIDLAIAVGLTINYYLSVTKNLTCENKMRTTKLQRGAENIVAQMVKATGGLYDAPVIRQETETEIRIYWDGPTDWTMNDGYGEFAEYAASGEEFGFTPVYEESNYWSDPTGIFSEPYNYGVLAVYLD